MGLQTGLASVAAADPLIVIVPEQFESVYWKEPALDDVTVYVPLQPPVGALDATRPLIAMMFWPVPTFTLPGRLIVTVVPLTLAELIEVAVTG